MDTAKRLEQLEERVKNLEDACDFGFKPKTEKEEEEKLSCVDCEHYRLVDFYRGLSACTYNNKVEEITEIKGICKDFKPQE